MKRTIKSLSMVLALSVLISAFCISPVSADTRVITDGTYRVGTDISAGEYIITPSTNYDANYAIIDENGQYIESDSSRSRSVVQLSNNQSIRLSHSDMMTALDSPQLDLPSRILPQGTYRAGIDIPAARYALKPNTDQWVYGTYEIYEVYSDSAGYHKRFINQEMITEETTVFLNPWQYIKTRNLNIIIPDNTPTSPLHDNWISS
ncbi:hypothetical protein [Caproiciproducens sp.]|uniref:hypothetical protein n=1 Tax=Caproiciproducens sp. TaxID=1954376 RepID=UPI0028A211DC|nr:hypothetical protein [Caproiciproducens sp.]